MKKKVVFILKIILIVILSYITLDIFFSKVFNYLFIDILNECLIDEYWTDCSWPIFKSSIISELTSSIIWLLIWIIYYKKSNK